MAPPTPAADRRAPAPVYLLEDLRLLYERVPHVDIKFQLDLGQEFLRALRSVAGVYTVAQVADALAVTPTTIYTMRKIPLDPSPKRWPTHQQTARLGRALTRAKGRGYYSAERLAVHEALASLLQEGFTVIALARRLKVPVAELERHVRRPVAPQVLNREVADILAAPASRTRRTRRTS